VGRAALADARATLCHVLSLLFALVLLFHHSEGQPPRFMDQVLALFRTRLLPPLRAALDGPVASRWPGVREALGALVAAGEKAPLPASEFEWLAGALAAWQTFAATRFLTAEVEAREAAVILDPFGSASTSGPPRLPARAQPMPAAGPPSWAPAAQVRPGEVRLPVEAKPAKPARLPKPSRHDQSAGLFEESPVGAASVPSINVCAPASGPASAGPSPRGGPLGMSPRHTEMRYFDLTQSMKAPIDFGRGPKAWNNGGSTFRVTGRSALERSGCLPPAAPPSTKGCFFNASTRDYLV